MGITPAGLDVVREVRTIVHAHERDWMAVLTDAELKACVALQHRIQDSLESG